MAVEQRGCRLGLGYQGLHEFPEEIVRLHGPNITELDLTFNKIGSYRFLLDLPRIETLVLDSNGLKARVKFPTTPSLRALWVNENNIDNLSTFVETISKSFPSLRILSMMKNPAAPSFFNGGSFVQYTDYRHYVISQLPVLELLDDQKVTPEERAEAERIYKRRLSPQDKLAFCASGETTRRQVSSRRRKKDTKAS